MSTAIRGVDVTARERLIPPPGNCVDGPEAPVFTRLDEGAPNPDDLELGKAACASCLHLSVCETNRHELAVQIAKLTHNGIAFIGGEEVDSRPDDIRPRIIDEIVPFSLKEIPSDPRLALSFLRMGVRNGTFRPGGHTPPIVADLADRFIGQLYGANRRLHAELIGSETLSIERATKGVQDITSILFQHADYDNVVAGRRTRLRYRPDRLPPDVHHEVSVAFCEDMLSLANRRFTKPERQALYFSPEEYQKLTAQYSDEINPTDLHYVFLHSIRDPETELRRRLARLRILQETHHGTDIPISALQQRARWSLNEDPTTGVKKRPTPSRISASSAKAIIGGAEVEDGAKVGLVELSDVARTVRAMHQEFGDDPTFTYDAFTRFGHLSPEEAVRRGKEIQQQVAKAFADRDTQPLHRHVSDGLLRRRILVGGYTDYETLYRDCRIKFMTNRFAQRKRLNLDTATRPTPVWAVELTMDTYDDHHFEGAAEQLYDLYSVKGLVTAGISELTLLQDINYHIQLKGICHPRTGQYVAFAPGLELMSPLERLAIASYFGLDKLMYGQTIQAKQLSSLLETTDFDAYVRETILPRAMNLKEISHGIAVTMMRLSKDLDLLNNTQSERHVEPRDIVTIIGKTVMQIGPAGIELGNDRMLSSDASQWLRRTIYKRCGGQYQDMTRDIVDAISNGILVISPEGDDYRIDFNPKLHEQADEQTIAALAHTLGIDTFMYGCDLKDILETRLETTIGAAAQQLAAIVGDIQPPAPAVSGSTAPDVELKPKQAAVQVPTPRTVVRSATPPPAKYPKQWLASPSSTLALPIKRNQTLDELLDLGWLRGSRDDAGRRIYTIPNSVRSQVPAEALVAQAHELGVYTKLHTAERNSLEAEIKRLRAIPANFPRALSTMAHLASPGLTSGQRIRFQTLLAFHTGYSKVPEEWATTDQRLFDRGILQLVEAFKTYRSAKPSFEGMRPRTQLATTLALLNDLLHPDAKQRKTMRAAVQSLPSQVETQDRRYAHIDCQAELINFGRWAALYLIHH